MFDSLKEIANKRLQKKKLKDEADKARKKGDMLNPEKFERPMGLHKLFGKREDDDEDEDV